MFTMFQVQSLQAKAKTVSQTWGNTIKLGLDLLNQSMGFSSQSITIKVRLNKGQVKYLFLPWQWCTIMVCCRIKQAHLHADKYEDLLSTDYAWITILFNGKQGSSLTKNHTCKNWLLKKGHFRKRVPSMHYFSRAQSIWGLIHDKQHGMEWNGMGPISNKTYSAEQCCKILC